MAVEFISDVVVTSSADSGSQSVTVPSDADCMLIGVGGWTGGARVLMPMTTLTLNGVACTALQSSNNSSFDKIDFRRLVAPAVGSQTLAWDFGGTGAISEGALFLLAFFKGVDQASPIIGSGLTTGTTDVTGLGTAGAGDMMCGMSVSFDTAVTVTGSSQTSLSTPARFNSCFIRGARKLAANSYDISGGDGSNIHAAALLRAASITAHPRFQAQLIGV
jgi:hypothetical protein